MTLVPILAAFLQAAPVTQGVPLSAYQGMWIGPETEESLSRTVQVEGLHVTVSEACLPSGDGRCDYQANAIVYAPLRAAAAESSVSALVVDYGDKNWRQSLVLRPVEGRLEAFVYTAFIDVPGKRRVFEHQVLNRAVRARRPRMPQFPWPPPPATASLRLPDGLVVAPGRDSLGVVFDRLTAALARVDVGWWSVYAIGTNGFAIVTRMEAIESDGRPKPGPARWNTPQDRVPPEISGLGDYFRALLFARPGFYRVIVLAVTDRPSQSLGALISADSANRLLRGGTDQLPASMRRVRVGVDGRCLALIYEFQRPTEQDSARLLLNAPIGALQHLTQAGIWSEQELRP